MGQSVPPSGGGAPAAAPTGPVLLDRKKRLYIPAVSPRLKVLLLVIFAAVALLGASGAYLASISFLNWLKEPVTYTSPFTLWMFLLHVVLGVVIVLPFVVFGVGHYLSARKHKNRPAVRLGIALFAAGLGVCLTGLGLVQLEGLPQLPTGLGRTLAYWGHLLLPAAAVGLYVWHRWAGPEIQWKFAYGWAGAVGVFVAAMAVLHFSNPRQWFAQGSKEGRKYFFPSRAVTSDAKFISADVLMADQYCLKCHEDAYQGWFHSAHHFSSFNNPAYLFSVKETREVGLKRDGNVRASRWCAGCHDPVPFFSGKFDDPDYDITNDPTAHAGITCTTCHAITNVNSTVGNGDYTIEEPLHYPFAFSRNPVLQWVNNQMVKAKPDFHKRTFLKPFHKTGEFCSTCHKVSLPVEVTHYKEWNRGQNHWDSFLLSGVHGGNARAFYYPDKGKETCADCHMPAMPSQDFGARDFDGTGERKIHDHLFPGANTGLMTLLSLSPRYQEHAEGFAQASRKHADFLKDKKLRLDIFGVRANGALDGTLTAPLRPELPRLKPGSTYLLEVVLRTLGVGHIFPQGTLDSNEIWVDVEARSGGRVVGRNGALDGPKDTGRVDEWAHFANGLVLDRHGNRINRRNPQDIFTSLYDHQIPPGAAHVVHYRFTVPPDVSGPIELTAKLRYRKFDFEYMTIVHNLKDAAPEQQLAGVPKLPIIDLCEDRVVLPVEGVPGEAPAQQSPVEPAWQRWNDYGIGLFLAADADVKKPGLLQAVQAFEALAQAYPGEPKAKAAAYLNLARAHERNGELVKAGEALDRIREEKLPAPWWSVAWFTGLVNAQNNHLDRAVQNFRDILDPARQDGARGFDFGQDYVVRNELALALFRLSQQEVDDLAARDRFLRAAVAEFEQSLKYDTENLDAHEGLRKCYERLGEPAAPEDRTAAALLPEGEMEALARRLADTSVPVEERVQAAHKLGDAVTALGQRETIPEQPRTPSFVALLGPCRQAFRSDPDPRVQAAAAYVLGQVHRELHAIYRPDDNARDTTTAKYRKKFPAAHNAAQAVKVYPLNRAGAPGL